MDNKDLGARPADQALAVPATPASGRDASRFDPSRMERRRQFLLDWFNGETVTFADRSGRWTILDFLAEMDWVSLDDIRAQIRARLPKGQRSKWAEERSLCDETIQGFLRGARPPADDLLATLGWERRIFYRRVYPCGCHRCTRAAVRRDPMPDEPFGDPRLARMFLCETCGNKRCPHAADHRLTCTNSNEPGQPGSLYEPASAIEAGTAETGTGSVHESAVANGETPTPNPIGDNQ